MSTQSLCDTLLGIGLVGCAFAIFRLRVAISVLQQQIKNLKTGDNRGQP